MPGKSILFIDDETLFAQNYLRSLREAGFEVIYLDNAGAGLTYIEEHGGEIDLIVLDVMMPTPDGVAGTDTEEGHATGIWVLHEACETIRVRPLPVIVLSNRGAAELVEAIHARVYFPEGLVTVTTKTLTSAMRFPDVASRMCRQWER